MSADTIFALSSGRPPAAVSIIRVSGPLAHAAGKRLGEALRTIEEYLDAELRFLLSLARDADSRE